VTLFPSQPIREEALRLGFSHCGFTPAVALEQLRPFYLSYLERGGHEGFRYISGHYEKRINPALLLPGVRTVIAVLLNYYQEMPVTENNPYRIARYALGSDYHPLMKERLRQLEAYLALVYPGHSTRSFIDSGPVLEKQWAQLCGLGFIGKHSLLVNRSEGSWFFIGVLLTTAPLTPDRPETDGCGHCDRCITACPTGALETPYVLDIRRCISYHTIEKKEPMSSVVRERLGGRIFGCDACQEACPYNRFARPTSVSEFQCVPEVTAMGKSAWEALTPEEFARMFGNSTIGRTGYSGLMENIRAAGSQGSDTPPESR
jgi:epoxyqueuosine reductase